jgi:hypothetical protein
MKEKQLIHNSVTCLQCGEVLVSNHVHDYKTCSCPQATMCDGGAEYGRYGGKDLNLVQTNYLYDDESHSVIREYLSRGGRGIKGDEPLKYVLLKDVDDSWLQAIIDYEELNRPQNKFLPIYRAEQKFRKGEN